jgi:hypothetical protein
MKLTSSDARRFGISTINDTARLYRYFDATSQAEYLYQCIEETIHRDLRDEIGFWRYGAEGPPPTDIDQQSSGADVWNCHRAWQNIIHLRRFTKNFIAATISSFATKSRSEIDIRHPMTIFVYISHRMKEESRVG